ncbi:hypothetical protein BJF84_21235 [Rhodococcus sp. CUA-806]|nr:hypothetical protein BJF84_21235 [Rhodococcus sp. CUA-806]
MTEFLGSLAIGEVGAGTLVVIIVLCIIFGKLVPVSQLNALRADKDKQITELNTAGEAYRATIAELLTQNTKLTGSVDTATHAVEAMQRVAESRGGS